MKLNRKYILVVVLLYFTLPSISQTVDFRHLNFELKWTYKNLGDEHYISAMNNPNKRLIALDYYLKADSIEISEEDYNFIATSKMYYNNRERNFLLFNLVELDIEYRIQLLLAGYDFYGVDYEKKVLYPTVYLSEFRKEYKAFDELKKYLDLSIKELKNKNLEQITKIYEQEKCRADADIGETEIKKYNYQYDSSLDQLTKTFAKRENLTKELFQLDNTANSLLKELNAKEKRANELIAKGISEAIGIPDVTKLDEGKLLELGFNYVGDPQVLSSIADYSGEIYSVIEFAKEAKEVYEDADKIIKTIKKVEDCLGDNCNFEEIISLGREVVQSAELIFPGTDIAIQDPTKIGAANKSEFISELNDLLDGAEKINNIVRSVEQLDDCKEDNKLNKKRIECVNRIINDRYPGTSIQKVWTENYQEIKIVGGTTDLQKNILKKIFDNDGKLDLKSMLTIIDELPPELMDGLDMISQEELKEYTTILKDLDEKSRKGDYDGLLLVGKKIFESVDGSKQSELLDKWAVFIEKNKPFRQLLVFHKSQDLRKLKPLTLALLDYAFSGKDKAVFSAFEKSMLKIIKLSLQDKSIRKEVVNLLLKNNPDQIYFNLPRGEKEAIKRSMGYDNSAVSDPMVMRDLSDTNRKMIFYFDKKSKHVIAKNTVTKREIQLFNLSGIINDGKINNNHPIVSSLDLLFSSNKMLFKKLIKKIDISKLEILEEAFPFKEILNIGFLLDQNCNTPSCQKQLFDTILDLYEHKYSDGKQDLKSEVIKNTIYHSYGNKALFINADNQNNVDNRFAQIAYDQFKSQEKFGANIKPNINTAPKAGSSKDSKDVMMEQSLLAAANYFYPGLGSAIQYAIAEIDMDEIVKEYQDLYNQMRQKELELNSLDDKIFKHTLGANLAHFEKEISQRRLKLARYCIESEDYALKTLVSEKKEARKLINDLFPILYYSSEKLRKNYFLLNKSLKFWTGKNLTESILDDPNNMRLAIDPDIAIFDWLYLKHVGKRTSNNNIMVEWAKINSLLTNEVVEMEGVGIAFTNEVSLSDLESNKFAKKFNEWVSSSIPSSFLDSIHFDMSSLVDNKDKFAKRIIDIKVKGIFNGNGSNELNDIMLRNIDPKPTVFLDFIYENNLGENPIDIGSLSDKSKGESVGIWQVRDLKDLPDGINPTKTPALSSFTGYPLNSVWSIEIPKKRHGKISDIKFRFFYTYKFPENENEFIVQPRMYLKSYFSPEEKSYSKRDYIFERRDIAENGISRFKTKEIVDKLQKMYLTKKSNGSYSSIIKERSVFLKSPISKIEKSTLTKTIKNEKN